MTISSLLKVLKKNKLKVGLVNGEVQVKSTSSEAIPSDIIGLLKSHKDLLADWLRNQYSANPTAISRHKTLPLSFSQAQLWLADRIEDSSALYNVCEAFFLNGELDNDALITAFTQLVERHEVLRTVYPSGERQEILEAPKPFPISFLVFDTVPNAEKIRATIAQEMNVRFDLLNDWMLRVKVISLPDGTHYLLITTHHIASDGWSLDILRSELSELYRAARWGRPSTLPSLPLQVADLAYWQRQQLNGEVLHGLLSYWKQQLAGCPPIHSIPLDFPRTPSAQGTGANVRRTLHSALTSAFESYCSGRGATMFMGMYTAFTVLLSRLGEDRDIVVGTTVANRELPDSINLIGYFVNSLVLRLSIPEKGEFGDLLEKSRDVILGAFENQSLPFERLVTELAPPRDSSYNPLFQISINMVNTYRDPLLLEGINVEEVELESIGVPLDLTLHIYSEGDYCRLIWEYNSNLFRQETIEKMHTEFESLIAQIVDHNNVCLSDLSGKTDPRPDQMRMLGKGLYSPITVESYTELWHQQVAKTPEYICYSDDTQALSYHAIDSKAEQLANRLALSGIDPQTPVGVHLHRSSDLLVALLAIFKVGAHYVPLEHKGPADRNSYIIEDSGISHIISRQQDGHNLPDKAEILDPECVDRSPRRSIPSSRAGDIAYIMYTSGSTGRPKGVKITQKGLVNYVQYAKATYVNNSVNRSLFYGPLTFDATITSLLVPVVMGHRLVAAPSGGEISFLAEEIFRENALIKITPAHLAALSHCLHDEMSLDLRHVFVIGGENLTWRLIRPWVRAFPNARFFNEYGPTEAVVGCCVYEIRSSVTRDSGSVPIGRPIYNTDLFVVKGNEPADAWQKGELCIAGPGVAKGYQNLPTLTSERFTSLTLEDGCSTRVYKTGDVVAWQPDGQLAYFGRDDTQVKLNGFRIELGEIEAALRQLVGVRDCAVICNNKTIVAFVRRVHTANSISEEGLKAALMEALPQYMIPHSIVMLGALPLTDNGKVDRKRLIEMSRNGQMSETKFPRSRMEKAMYKIWADLLDLGAPICIHSNFFAVGGNSLKAIQLVDKVNQQFSLRLSPRDVLLNPTIASMARHAADSVESRTWVPYTILTYSDDLMNTYCVPGVCGQSAMFGDLSVLLRSYTNCIALEHKGLDGRYRPFESYKNMLDTFVDVVNATIQGYRANLCGHSFGALIVQDLAWILAREGYDIRVIMLDACFADVGRAIKSVSDEDLETLSYHFYGEAQTTNPDLVAGFQAVYRNHQKYIKEHVPLGHTSAPLLYFSASEGPHSSPESVTAWLNTWCGNHEVVTANGGHDSILHHENIRCSIGKIKQFIGADCH